MNEEQAVLEFFSRTENLSLGLSVAEQMDELRVQMNNRLWRDLQGRLNSMTVLHGLAWQVEITEDRNAPDSLVGLHCIPRLEQALHLRPMMEQQYLGGIWRIYSGLIWSAPPSPDQPGLPAVSALKAALQTAGFKSNENFLAWQWTAFHPRRKDFLLRYSLQPEKLLGEMETILQTLLIGHSDVNRTSQCGAKNRAAQRGNFAGSIAQQTDRLNCGDQTGLSWSKKRCSKPNRFARCSPSACMPNRSVA